MSCIIFRTLSSQLRSDLKPAWRSLRRLFDLAMKYKRSAITLSRVFTRQEVKLTGLATFEERDNCAVAPNLGDVGTIETSIEQLQ